MSQTPDMWYVRSRGHVQGPYSIAQLRQLLERGRFSRHHEVSDDGASWRRATDIPDLFSSRVQKKVRAVPAPAEILPTEEVALELPDFVPPPAERATEPSWMYVENEKRCGPIPESELRTLLLEGKVPVDSLIWTEGWPDWVAACNVPTFRSATTTKPTKSAPTSIHKQSFCFACGLSIDPRAELCPSCGVRQTRSATSGKDRGTAALLALFLGGLGVHHFYLGNTALGVLYLLFCWTLIPAVVSCVEGIVFLCMSDSNFHKKYPST